MCGLVGVAGQIGHQEKKIFAYLHIFDIIRGRDSSGIFTVNDKDETKVVKSVGYPDALPIVNPKMFDQQDFLLSDTNLRVIAGHNRAATQGLINDVNAHPFEYENIIGMHNGTLQTWSMSKFNGYKDYDVDSQILFSEIDGEREFKDIYHDVSGAMALVWWDNRNSSLNIARNHERPLWYTFINNKKTLIWASEPWMISVACSRANYKLTEENKTKSVKVHRHYVVYPTFDLKDGVPGEEGKVLEPRPTYVQRYPQSYAGGYNRHYPANHKTSTAVPPKTSGNNTVVGGFVFINGMIIQRQEMEAVLDNKDCRCVWCDGTPPIDDARNMKWFDRQNFVCNDCESLPAVKEHLAGIGMWKEN